MSALYAVTCLAACLAQAPAEPPLDLPEGIHGLTGRVVEVRGKDLIVEIEPIAGDRATWAERPHCRLRITGRSQLSVLKRGAGSDQADATMKPIQLKDLSKGQAVAVTVYSDGERAEVLSCVASGLNLPREEVFQHVAALGGKHRKVPGFSKGKIPDRWTIDLSGTKTKDSDLVVIGRLADLDDLNLSFTAVTDRGIKNLRSLSQLQDLDLTGTKVTDTSLPALRRFDKLRRISLARSGITKEGVERLLRDRPDLELCRIASGPKAQFRIIERFSGVVPLQKDLMIGNTLFAVAYPHRPGEPDRSRLATTYYHRQGPVGQVLRSFDWFPAHGGANAHWADLRLPASLVAGCAGPAGPANALVGLWSEPPIGVIRLNAGTHACYGRPLQYLDFYDNSPDLQVFCFPPAGQPRVFDYVHDALARGCRVRLLKGDERRTLAGKGPQAFYHALFADIAREDLQDVNLALMTREGMAELMGSLTKEGILCYHTSHRHYQFSLPLADVAKSLGFAWKVAKDKAVSQGHRDKDDEAHFSSEWFVVARKAEYLERLSTEGTVEWSVPEATGRHLWRDGQVRDLKPLMWKNR
jgi:hypothetical protein